MSIPTNLQIAGVSYNGTGIPLNKTYKSGTYTPSQTYNSNGNRLIVSQSDLGFTPSQFIMWVADMDDVSGIAAYVYAGYLVTSDLTVRTGERIDSSGTMTPHTANTSISTVSAGYLHITNGNVYARSSSTYVLPQGVTYNWIAIE